METQTNRDTYRQIETQTDREIEVDREIEAGEQTGGYKQAKCE